MKNPMLKRLAAISFLFLVLLSHAAVALADEDPGEAKAKSVIEGILPGSLVEGQGVVTKELKTEVVPTAIKVVLGLAGTVSFGVFVYAGVMLIIAQGNEEDITKFKNILMWSLVGLIFITTAYALVRGVMQLVFK